MSRQAFRIMRRAPTLSAIYAAELKVTQARLQAQAAFGRGRLAMRAALVRPATLATVTTVSAVFGYWLTRRILPPRPAQDQTDSVSASESTVSKASGAALILPVIVGYAKQQLPALLRQLMQVWTARKHAERVRA
jgi:hypothetical protein